MTAPHFFGLLIGVAVTCLPTRQAAPQDTSAVLFRDNFANKELSQRRALRGEWKIADGVAACTQDDALYRKYRDHGPILIYDVPHDTATVRFRVRPDGCRTIVFTANGDNGHVFRFVLSDRGINIRAFPPDAKTKSLAVHSDRTVKLKPEEWTDVVVKMNNENATVQVAGFKPISVTHASFRRPRKNISIGFSFGTLLVSDFTVTP